ncbi:MAG: flippase-like domain-containing protein [Planctomycetia bacterium]|nr:flippase-like domain-containing protein [Planctomycetia bacterium]
MKKKTLITLAKIVVSLAVIGYLLWRVFSDPKRAEMIERLRTEPKNWWLLLASWGCFFTSAILTFVRWYFLVRAVGLPFRFRDALRLGFLGFMFSQVSLGAVGGDMFKAVFLAHEHRGRRAESISTIFLDRLLGLYGLFLIGSLVVVSGQLGRRSPMIDFLSTFTLIGTGVMTSIFVVIMAPARIFGSLPEQLAKIPRIGHIVQKLWLAAGMYRTHHGVVWGALGITLVVHVINVFSYYCIARGLPGLAPDLASHFLIVPLGLLAGAIPLPFAALGPFELILNKLYQAVAPITAAGGIPMDSQLGLVVALCSRVMTLLVALVGVGFYLGGRREVKEVMQEAQQLQEAGADETLKANV